MKRRSSTILATLALSVSALAITAPAAAGADEPPGVAYVALGDSVASGNGNLPYLDETCLRSTRSYPLLLAGELGLAVVSEACTAASTADVLEQLGDLVVAGAIGAETELVTLTVGVNDVQLDADPDPDWGEVLGACSNKSPLPPEMCGILLTASLQVLATLPQKIEALIDVIRAEAPSAQIIVTGYPLLFGDFTGTCSVGGGVTFGEEEARLINAAVLQANGLIAQGVAAAGDANAMYVDVVAGFDGHGLCDTGDRWISGLIAPQARTTDRGFHPNAAGQRAFADILEEAIAG
jgi:lysophospholipase L1-like esterase